jgi:hypothetical protein
VTREKPLEYRGLTVADLRRAVTTYIGLAYPSGAIPDRVAERLKWPDGIGLDELLAGPAFEKTGPADSGTPVHALRLGNARYPHMKLQVQPWPTSVGYMLSVNTHDQLSGLPLKTPDAQQFEALQRENQRIKEAVEDAWDRQGFPTFLRYLRDLIAQGQIAPGTLALDDSSG